MEFLRSGNTFNTMGIWTTDYVPDTIDNMIGNKKVCSVLKMFIETGQIPNILLTGNHGTGKRTLATLLAHEYLGDDYSRGCLAIDGAINRGKDVIACNNVKKISDKTSMSTQNVLSFSQRKITLHKGKKKIVMIYNFEDMTSEAQNALRRIIETYEPTTRFILICNNLDNIIEAIQSRCLPLVTNLLTNDETHELISKLRITNHKEKLDDDIVKIITMLSSGDMKKVINYTQTISALDHVDIDTFHQIFNIPPIKVLEQILLDTQNLKTQPKVLERLTFLIEQGYAYSDILEMLSKILAHENVGGAEGLQDEVRFSYIKRLAEYYCQMSQQTNEIHLYALFSDFAEISCNLGIY